MIRGSEVGARDRVVVEHGVDAPIAWSPDNRHLLVGTVPELAPVIQTQLVDIDAGVQRKLPVTGSAAFLSDTEVAVTSYRQRTVAILPLGERAGAGTICEVPGEYRFLLDLVGLPDGTMVLETEAPAAICSRSTTSSAPTWRWSVPAANRRVDRGRAVAHHRRPARARCALWPCAGVDAATT